jgi:hypothetical protein
MGPSLDFAFEEVDVPPSRPGLWLGVAGVAMALVALFVLAPKVAFAAGLIVLAAVPLLVLAGDERTRGPLVAAGAAALVALGASAALLAAEYQSAYATGTAQHSTARAAGSMPAMPQVVAAAATPVRPLPAPADIKLAPPESPAAAPAAEPERTAAPAPEQAPAAAPEPAPEPVAAVADSTAQGGGGTVPAGTKTQACDTAKQTGAKAPKGLCR